MASSGEHRPFIVEEFIKNGGSPRSPDFTPSDFFSLGLPQSKGLRTASPNWRRRYDRKLLPLHLKWFSRSRTATERGYISVSIFKAATWVMFCSKHVDVKRHSVCFPEIKKIFIFFGFEFISFPNRGFLSAAPCRLFRFLTFYITVVVGDKEFDTVAYSRKCSWPARRREIS